MAAPSHQHRKISDIKSNLLRPALTSHFEVHIPLPSFVQLPNGVTQDQLYLQCSEASLPGSSLATFEINNDHHGVTERHAYRRIFDDRIDLTFYVDADNYLPIRTFEKWIGGIMNGNEEQKELKLNQSEYYYTALYPDDYRKDLYITKFERSHDIDGSNIKYTFVKAFPISISSMPVSYDSSNLLKCTVGFTYLRYFTGAAEAKSAPRVSESAVSSVPEINTALQDQVGNTNAEDQRLIPTDNATGFRGQLLEPLRDAAGNIVSDLTGNRLPFNQ